MDDVNDPSREVIHANPHLVGTIRKEMGSFEAVAPTIVRSRREDSPGDREIDERPLCILSHVKCKGWNWQAF